MKRFALISICLLAFAAAGGQSIVDYPDGIELQYANGDTIPIRKSEVARPYVSGGVVRLLPANIGLDFSGRPPNSSLSVDPDVFGYSSVYHLRQDLSVMLGFRDYKILQSFDGSGNVDTIFYVNPRNSDTLRYTPLGYSGSNNTTINESQH